MVFSVFCAADVYGSKWNICVEFPGRTEDLLQYTSFVETVESAFEYECRRWAPADAPAMDFYVEYITKMEAEMVGEHKAVYYSGERVTDDTLPGLEDGAQLHVHQYGIPESTAMIPPARNTITPRLLDMFHLRGTEADLVQQLFQRFDTRGSAFFTKETMAEAFPHPAAAMPLVQHTFAKADPNGLGYITFGSWLEFLHAEPDRKYDIDNEWNWQVAKTVRDRDAYYANTTESGNRKRPVFPPSGVPKARPDASPTPSKQSRRHAHSPSGRHTPKALFQDRSRTSAKLSRTEPQAAAPPARTPLKHHNHNIHHGDARAPKRGGDAGSVATPGRGRAAERHARAAVGSPSPPMPQALPPKPIAQDIFPTYPADRQVLPPARGRVRVSQLALPRRPITRSSSRGRVR